MLPVRNWKHTRAIMAQYDVCDIIPTGRATLLGRRMGLFEFGRRILNKYIIIMVGLDWVGERKRRTYFRFKGT